MAEPEAEVEKKIGVIVTAPVTKGSIVLVSDGMVDDHEMAAVMTILKYAAGHDRFLLLKLQPGHTLSVFGPDDLAEAIRELAKEAMNAHSTEEDKPSNAGPGIIGAGHGGTAGADPMSSVRSLDGSEKGARRG